MSLYFGLVDYCDKEIIMSDTNQPKPRKTKDQEKIEEMQETVDRTKKVMVDNIDKLLERGDKLEQLVDKTEQTEDKSQLFNQNAKQMQIKARFQNIAIGAALVGLVVGGFYGLSAGIGLPMVAICGGIGAVVCYSAVWMFSGAIQSILKLPFLSLGFNEAPSNVSASSPEPKNVIELSTPGANLLQLYNEQLEHHPSIAQESYVGTNENRLKAKLAI